MSGFYVYACMRVCIGGWFGPPDGFGLVGVRRIFGGDVQLVIFACTMAVFSLGIYFLIFHRKDVLRRFWCVVRGFKIPLAMGWYGIEKRRTTGE